MADRRRKSPDGSGYRRWKDSRRSEYEGTTIMRATETMEIPSSPESSSSSSYIDISRSFPLNRFGGLKAFFTAPSERRRRAHKRRSSRLLKLTNSSSSSVNSDLAYGTGFIRRSKSKVRSRKGKEIDRESRYKEGERRSSRDEGSRTSRSGASGRDPTNAELLALGANFRKLARESNQQNLRTARNGKGSEVTAVKDTSYSATRGLGPSQIIDQHDSADDDGWESASDDDSETSVDSRLAFGEESTGGWSFFGKKKHSPLSKKKTIVDPRLFGPANSLNGIITRPVGFGEVSPWSSNSDFGQPCQSPPYFHEPRKATYIDQEVDQRSEVEQQPSLNYSQIPLQQVYPVQTADPSRFDVARSSVTSGTEPYIPRRPEPVPIQQPQPFTPVSQSMYEPIYSARSEASGILKKPTSSNGRGKSIAEAALVGVMTAAGGAAIAASREKREDRRRDDELADLDRERLRRRETERKEIKDEGKHRRSSPERKDTKDEKRSRHGSPERDVCKESRRDKDKHRDKRHEESRDEKEERRERRREERRAERSEVGAAPRRSNSETAVFTTAVDPFQFQIPDESSTTPKISSHQPERETGFVPTVVTVEREPDFIRKRSSSIKEKPSTSRSEPEGDYSQWDAKDQGHEPISPRDKIFHEAENIYQETERSTAPIEVAAIGAAVAAVSTEGYRESRSDKRREERRSERRDDYDDRDYKPRAKETTKERDPIQEEADRAYREIVMARKIASQVIRQRTPSPDRSVVRKYDEKEEEEIIRIVTPPGMEDHKKKGPYDAPNADFRPDNVLEDPRELQNLIPAIRRKRSDSIPVRDPGTQKPRPLLNLVRPTPVPSPMPEKQAPRNERARSSSKSEERPRSKKEHGESKRPSSDDVVIGPKGNVVPSPTTSNVPKGVTWGENETKHFEVESPSDHKEEFISNEELRSRESPRTSKDPQSNETNNSMGWAAMAAGIISVGAGAAAAASSSESSRSPKSKPKKDEKPSSYEYRGVVVETEPETPPRDKRQPSPPSPGPKPTSQLPGAFEDDLDFTATVAAGLQDTGFDPNIVIDDPSFRRRASPPGPNEPSPIYRAPFAETVSDLSIIPPSEPSSSKYARGFVMGDVATTPRDSQNELPPVVEKGSPITLSNKEQKKRDTTRRQSSETSTPLQERVVPREIVEEPKLSKKEQKRRDKAAAAQKQSSLAESSTSTSTATPLVEPYIADKMVEEPESYVETSKKGKKKSKKGPSSDDVTPESPRHRAVSASRNTFDDVIKSDKNKLKRDSEKFDSPSRSATMPESFSELERLSSKKTRREDERLDSPSRSTASFGTASDLGLSSSNKPKRDGEPYDSPSQSAESFKTALEMGGSSNKTSTRNSERYDSPSRSEPIEITSELEKSLSNNSKRENELYDSPSTGSFETALGLERSSSIKSKDKLKRRTEPEQIDPADIALPPSTPSENGREGDFDDSRTSRKSSMKDSAIFSSSGRSDSRSAASTVTSRYEDNELRRKKKHRSSTRDDDDTRSVVSEPAGGDETKKKDRKSAGGFFSLFGSKSEVGAHNESPREPKDDIGDVKKKKKSKRHSTTDASSLYSDIGSLPFGDTSKPISNGHNDGNRDADHDSEKKKSRPRSASTSSKKDSFLGKADTLGAGVGLAAVAVAIATQLHPQSKAGNANESEDGGEGVRAEKSRSGDSDRARAREEREASVDPEIKHLDFRPSIDPQYGDLLPLPPSEPASPNVEPLDNLPKLPDSPGTPEDERIARERSATLTRRNLQETPTKSLNTKSPSQSAVPLKFLLGNRSQPSSPSFTRSPPIQVPAAPNQESPVFPRIRHQRPTSWDSSKEYKPLFLVESTRRGSSAQAREMEEFLPDRQSHPPSHILQDLGSTSTNVPSSKSNPLILNTVLASPAAPHDLVDSQQSTPKARFMLMDEAGLPKLPPQPKVADDSVPTEPTERLLSPARDKQWQSHGLGIPGVAAAAGLTSSLGYFASSPSYPKTKDSWMDDLPSVQRQPLPVDSMSKDRSSYLLGSSPLSQKSDDAEVVESEKESPKSDSLESGTFHSVLSVQERDGSDYFASAPETPIGTEQHRDGTLESLPDTPVIELSEEPFFTKSKKSKKGKKGKKGKVLSRSSIDDDVSSLPEPGQDRISEAMNTPIDEPPEDFAFTESKKDKKDKKGKAPSQFPTQNDILMPLESSQSVISTAPASALPELADKVFTPSKSGPPSGATSDDATQELISEASQEAATLGDSTLAGETSIPVSKKGKKKNTKKTKSISAGEHKSEQSTVDDQTFHSTELIPVPEPVFKPTRQATEDMTTSEQISHASEASTLGSREERKDDSHRSISASPPELDSVPGGNVLKTPATAVPTLSGVRAEEFPLIGGEHSDDLSFIESKKNLNQDGKNGKNLIEPEADEFFDSQELLEHATEGSRHSQIPPTDSEDIWHETGMKTKQSESISSRDLRDNHQRFSTSTSPFAPDPVENVPQEGPDMCTDQNLTSEHMNSKDQGPSNKSVNSKEAIEPATHETPVEIMKSAPTNDPVEDDIALPETQKRKKKKKGKSATTLEPEEEAATSQAKLHDIEPDVEEAATQDNPDEIVVKKGKKGKKKKGKSTVAQEPESKPTLPESPAEELPAIPSQDVTVGTVDVEEPDLVEEKKGNPTTPWTEPQVESPIEQDPALSESQSQDLSMATIHDATSETAVPVGTDYVENKKSKKQKKKSKLASAREPEAENNAPQTPQEKEEAPELVIPGPNKSEKEGKKSHSWTEEDTRTNLPPDPIQVEPSESPRDLDNSTNLSTEAEFGQKLAETELEKFSPPSKKNKKELKEEQSWEPEPEQQAPAEGANESLAADVIDESHTPEAVEKSTPSVSKKGKKKKKKSRNLDIEEQPSPSTTTEEDVKSSEPEKLLASLEGVPNKPTPVGDLGSQLATPDTPLIKGGPSDTQEIPEKTQEKSYDPSTTPPLPPATAGVAILGLKSFHKEIAAADQTISNPTGADVQVLQVDKEVKQTPDGLDAGYKEDQLTLARQLKEESGTGNKKSKKDKKKGPSLSVTPERQLSISKLDEEVREESSRAGSLSIGPSGDETRASLVSDESKTISGEEQLELARQIKAEFECGKKSEKEESRTATQDNALDQHNVNEPQLLPVVSNDVQKEEPAILTSKGDEIAPSYQEDQLSLARQPQADLSTSSKKSKKGKKSQSSSRTPQDEELSADSFGDRTQDSTTESAPLDRPQTVPEVAIEQEILRDGLTVGYDEEQHELAGQLKEELASDSSKKSKKGKKGKKRESLPGSIVEDDLTSDSIIQDINQDNPETPTSGDVNAAVPNEPVTAEPEDEYAFVSKKSKKGKKHDTDDQLPAESSSRDVSVPANNNASREDETEKSLNEPTLSMHDEEVASVTKKSKKSKKGKKSGSALVIKPEEDSSSIVELSEVEASQVLPATPATESLPEPTHSDPEVEFAPVTKKSKEGKKGKKHASVISPNTKDHNARSLESEEIQQSRNEPAAVEASQPEGTPTQHEDESPPVIKKSQKDKEPKKGDSIMQESSSDTIAESSTSQIETFDNIPLAAIETSLPESLPGSPAPEIQHNRLEDIPSSIIEPSLADIPVPEIADKSIKDIPYVNIAASHFQDPAPKSSDKTLDNDKGVGTALPDTPVPELGNDLFIPTKKSRENKKGKQHEVVDQSINEEIVSLEPISSESEKFQDASLNTIETSLPASPAPVSPAFEPEDNYSAASKKPKKKKKGKKHDSITEGTEEEAILPEAIPSIDVDTPREAILTSLPESLPQPPALKPQDDDFAPITKKPKKDKKRKDKNRSGSNEDIPEESSFSDITSQASEKTQDAASELVEPSLSQSSSAEFEEEFGQVENNRDKHDAFQEDATTRESSSGNSSVCMESVPQDLLQPSTGTDSQAEASIVGSEKEPTPAPKSKKDKKAAKKRGSLLRNELFNHSTPDDSSTEVERLPEVASSKTSKVESKHSQSPPEEDSAFSITTSDKLEKNDSTPIEGESFDHSKTETDIIPVEEPTVEQEAEILESKQQENNKEIDSQPKQLDSELLNLPALTSLPEPEDQDDKSETPPKKIKKGKDKQKSLEETVVAGDFDKGVDESSPIKPKALSDIQPEQKAQALASESVDTSAGAINREFIPKDDTTISQPTEITGYIKQDTVKNAVFVAKTDKKRKDSSMTSSEGSSAQTPPAASISNEETISEGNSVVESSSILDSLSDKTILPEPLDHELQVASAAIPDKTVEEPMHESASVSTKKSKKGKKKRKDSTKSDSTEPSGTSMPQDSTILSKSSPIEIPLPSLNREEKNILSERPIQEPLSGELSVLDIHAEEPVDVWSSGEKSKDKKEQESSNSAELAESPAIEKITLPEPISESAGDASSSTLLQGDMRDNISAGEAHDLLKATSMVPSTTVDVGVIAESSDKLASPSTKKSKKSKKDRKKQKSGISTPIEETPSGTMEPSSHADITEDKSIEQPLSQEHETIPPVAPKLEPKPGPEWSSFSTQNSKKDEEQKSDLSILAEQTSAPGTKSSSLQISDKSPLPAETTLHSRISEGPSSQDLGSSLGPTTPEKSEEPPAEEIALSLTETPDENKTPQSGISPSLAETSTQQSEGSSSTVLAPPQTTAEKLSHTAEPLEKSIVPEPEASLTEDNDQEPQVTILEPEQSSFAVSEQPSQALPGTLNDVEFVNPSGRELETFQGVSQVTPEEPAITSVEAKEIIEEPTDHDWDAFRIKNSKDEKDQKSTPIEESPVTIPESSMSLPRGPLVQENISRDSMNIDPPTPSNNDKEFETQKPEDEEFASIAKKSKKTKKGKRASRRASVSGPSTPSASTIAISQLPEHIIDSPLPFEQNSHIEDDTNPKLSQEPIQVESIQRETDSSNISQTVSKKDKRKRQATIDSSVSDDLAAPKPPAASWGAEVEEAEVEREVPIIEEIANHESLANISSTTETISSDDFARPTKNGKMDKRNSVSLTSTTERSLFEESMDTGESSKDSDSTPALAATDVAAALPGKLIEDSGGPSSLKSAKKLTKKEQQKMSIDKRSPRKDIFDDPSLWEDAEPRVYAEESRGVDNDAGSDGFWSPPEEKALVREPGDVEVVPEEEIHGGEVGTESRLQTPRPRPRTPGIMSDRARPMSQDSEFFPGSPTLVGESQTSGDGGDEEKRAEEELLRTPSSQDKGKEYSQQDETINRVVFDERDFGTLSNRGSSGNLFQTPPAKKILSFEESPPIVKEYISELPLGLTPGKEIGLDFQNASMEHTPPLYYSGSKFSHSGFSDLPPVDEESPAQLEAERSFTPHAQDTEFNRDSGLVTDSPTPYQSGFAENHEHIRDSGVHLRDLSPAAKDQPPVSSSDNAIARLSWPTADDDREAADLHKSQKPPVKTVTKPSHKDSQETELHESPKSYEDKIAGLSFSQRLAEERKHSPPQQSRRPKGETATDFYRSQRSVGPESKTHHEALSRDTLPSQRSKEETHTELYRTSTVHGLRRSKVENVGVVESRSQEERSPSLRGRNSQGDDLVRQRLQRFESPDYQEPAGSPQPTKSKEGRYSELTSTQRPPAQQPKGFSELQAGAAIAGASLMGFAASRKRSQENRPETPQGLRASSNPSRLRSPETGRPESVTSNRSSNRSSGTPPLRRSDRKFSGDLRSISQRSKTELAKEAELAALAITAATSANSASTPANPTANEGRVRAKDMADVYDGFGEGRIGSPRSPTRPHSMRRRQSMQVLDLEAKIEQLATENRILAEYRAQAERQLHSGQRSSSALVEKDAEIDALKRTLEYLQKEVTRLTEVNEGLSSANATIARQHGDRYTMLEQEHAQVSRELAEARDAHINLSTRMDGIVVNKVQNAVENKDREIAQLCADLDAAKQQIREMQRQILASKVNDIDFLTIRDEDYFDNACQQLCQHVQQWVLRFSKFSDMRACRLTSEINNDKTIDRLDNAILDGSDVDNYLSDRVKRRDVFMSMTMTMVWEFIFTRYLFGMDRDQRQKLKSLEKTLSEVGPAAAVHHWRATTLTLLAKRRAFAQQREQDTQAVVHAILETLSEILPPPSHLEQQIEDQLMRVMKSAVDLSIEMRTQRAEYMMLPPLQPEYDANGDLASKVTFNAALMNERSGDTVSNEELEAQKAVVRIVLFPLVVKKGDDRGEGDEEIVVCPAQVLVAKPKKQVRVFSPSSMAGARSGNNSRTSMQSSMPENVL